MTALDNSSEFRIEKLRAQATVTLSSGRASSGCFFVALASAHHSGPERVGDLLNSEAGFFPFEIEEAGSHVTVLLHRDHVVMVTLAENEAARDPGYAVATRRAVSLLFSDGERVAGDVRVYRPGGRDRLSDWACQGERFRYVETADATLLINVDHVVEAREVSK